MKKVIVGEFKLEVKDFEGRDLVDISDTLFHLINGRMNWRAIDVAVRLEDEDKN